MVYKAFRIAFSCFIIDAFLLNCQQGIQIPKLMNTKSCTTKFFPQFLIGVKIKKHQNYNTRCVENIVEHNSHYILSSKETAYIIYIKLHFVEV